MVYLTVISFNVDQLNPSKYLVTTHAYNRKSINSIMNSAHSLSHQRHHKRNPSNTTLPSHAKHQLQQQQLQAQLKLTLSSIDLYHWRLQHLPPPCILPQTLKLAQHHPKNNALEVTAEQLALKGFPVLDYSIKELVEFSIKIFQTSQFGRLNFSEKLLRRTTNLLAANYHSVGYHNFSHGFSVMMLSYQCMAAQPSFRFIFNEEEYFLILIAGLAHDLNHPGTSNPFETKINTKIAQESKGTSVLEKSHVRHLWKLLEEHPELNFIEACHNKQKAKEIITKLIISTDMSFHFKSLDHFKQARADGGFDPKRKEEHKWMVMEQVMHACDIGNACYDFEQLTKWSALLSCEFAELAAMEEEAGLEVTKMLLIPNELSLYKDQIGFISTFTLPLWKQISILFPNLTPWLEQIQENLAKAKDQTEKYRN